jgi:hypothetical protein
VRFGAAACRAELYRIVTAHQQPPRGLDSGAFEKLQSESAAHYWMQRDLQAWYSADLVLAISGALRYPRPETFIWRGYLQLT